MPKTKPTKRPVDVISNAVHVMRVLTGEAEDVNPGAGKDPAAVSLGRRGGLKGGKARTEKLGREKISEIGRLGARARWGESTAQRGGSASPPKKPRKVLLVDPEDK